MPEMANSNSPKTHLFVDVTFEPGYKYELPLYKCTLGNAMVVTFARVDGREDCETAVTLTKTSHASGSAPQTYTLRWRGRDVAVSSGEALPYFIQYRDGYARLVARADAELRARVQVGDSCEYSDARPDERLATDADIKALFASWKAHCWNTYDEIERGRSIKVGRAAFDTDMARIEDTFAERFVANHACGALDCPRSKVFRSFEWLQTVSELERSWRALAGRRSLAGPAAAAQPPAVAKATHSPRFSLDLAKAVVYTQRPQEAAPFDAAQRARFEKGVEMFRDLCTGPGRTRAEKYKAVAAFLAAVPDEGIDMVKRWLDALQFVSDTEADEILDLLEDLLACPALPSHEKLTIAVTQYNKAYISRCYASFRKILDDATAHIDHRIEACRYLFATRLPELQAAAQEFLLRVIRAFVYPSAWRYRVIAGFITKTGLATFLNSSKLAIEYDEAFVYKLQHVFFHEGRNGVRERILSGQHLLEMAGLDDAERADVEGTLLGFAADPALDDNARADAADVLIRGGTAAAQERAQQIVTELGFSAVPTKDRTVYTNKQNVHAAEVGKSVAEFLAAIARDRRYLKHAKPYATVRTEISAFVRRAALERDARQKCYDALNRIDIDTAQYGEYKLTAADILAYVWYKVQRHEAREALERRLLDELMEMVDTCGTGHEIRPINALSGFEGHINVIRISFEDQVVANVVGRMNARIRAIEDEKLLDQVVTAPLPDAPAAAKAAYAEYVAAELADLRAELHEEFVGEGHVADAEFADYFAKGAAKFDL